jgi:hypothetical protein
MRGFQCPPGFALAGTTRSAVVISEGSSESLTGGVSTFVAQSPLPQTMELCLKISATQASSWNFWGRTFRPRRLCR